MSELRRTCGWCATNAKPTDSTTICPECLERHFPEPKLLSARAGFPDPVKIPLPGIFESRTDAASVISFAGCISAVLLLAAILGAHALSDFLIWVVFACS